MDILSRHKELEKTTYCHEILVKGADAELCKRKVLKFFETYQLVRYSAINVREDKSVSAREPEFTLRLWEAINKNRQILREMIAELQRDNVTTLTDLEDLPQGYKSKLLHVVSHFLDGFFGIDTYFFNLIEDSHWVSDETKENIEASPSNHWLLIVEGSI